MPTASKSRTKQPRRATKKAHAAAKKQRRLAAHPTRELLSDLAKVGRQLTRRVRRAI